MVVIDANSPVQAGVQIDGLQENRKIAGQLAEIANLLNEQHANEYRVNAYRSAAKTIAGLRSPVRDLLERDGVEALVALPTIGVSISGLIESAIRVGRIPLLDRLRGQSNAEHFFATVPGIGPQLSHRIYDHLHIETLPELLGAAKDGRLDRVPGIGQKRCEAIQACLSQRGVVNQLVAKPKSEPVVPIDELLEIDRDYLKRAKEGTLPKIRLSSRGSIEGDWVPVLHTEREGRHYTAMFSHTERAQQQEKTHDWVILFRDDEHDHGRWTVITAQYGELKGFRIVRGREKDCEQYYHRHNAYHQREAGHAPYPEVPVQWEREAGRFGVHG
ncbi:MAG TPA: DNA polymerase III [Rhodopirellula baltica]|uniref:Probable DNA polymerase family X n=1 Tax=Rhodopirellula baltica (strain DSM 10527 / NCIMB 13988 / SH1) TaxID=243090 RepID=Q7UHA8_RHOBA|nr:helix-hairpin-helix domain-containing protein [Rhodopirellula baltica]CAD78068.1 probable DNA polymerase family X [Rhodopirellula baltica SH 1]HBE64800.1 DNA polymerase III [Rhodopirellula baltica]